MIGLRKMAGAAAAIAALILIAPSSEAQVNKKHSAQATKLNAVSKTTPPKASKKPHRLILQVNSNEPAMMNLALNNASNVVQHYKDLGEKVSIEVHASLLVEARAETVVSQDAAGDQLSELPN
jgi:uncharacterized protein